MNKASRLSLLRSRHAALFGVALSSGLLPISRAEVQGEAKSARARAEAAGTDSLANDGDEFATVRNSRNALPFDDAETARPALRDKDVLLTDAERKQLAREYRKPVTVQAAPVALAPIVETFTPNPDALDAFIPAVPKGAAWVAEAEAEGLAAGIVEIAIDAARSMLLALPAPSVTVRPVAA